MTLTHDVGPCGAASGSNGAALTIKAGGTAPDPTTSPPTPADYVTLNLNGYRVYGCVNEDPRGPCNEPSVDVADQSLVAPFVTGEGPGIVIDKKDWVKITDVPALTPGPGPGTVSDFDTGIVIRGASNNVIEEVDVKRNVGSAATNSDYGEGIGIYTSAAAGSTNNTVRANKVDGNGPFAGVALYNFDDTTGTQSTACKTTDNTIGGPDSGDKNTVTNNYVTPSGTTYQDDGIRVEPDVCKTVVQNNEVSGSSLDGIAVFAKAVNTKVKNNLVTGNGKHPLPTQRKGDGIVVFQTANGCTVGDTVAADEDRNTASGNAGNGIRVDAYNCKVNGNTATGNAFNEIVNGDPVADPRGAADAESQYAYFDLKDGQKDKACGSIATTPTGGTRNYWGNEQSNVFGSRNRVPGTVLAPGPPPVVVPSHCIE